MLLLTVGRTATAQLYFASSNPGQNVPRYVYQPGQVAITGVQPGGYTSGGTMTNTSSYNGSASSDGSAAQSFSSGFAPSGLGDAVGAGVDAAFGLTGNQTTCRQPYGQQPI